VACRVCQQIAGQRGIAGTYCAARGDRLRPAVPAALGSGQYRAVRTQGGEHRGPGTAQQLGAGASGQPGVRFELSFAQVLAQQLGKLFGVGLDQIRDVDLVMGEELAQRLPRGINCNLRALRAELLAQRRGKQGVVVRRHTGRQRPCHDQPIGAVAGIAHQLRELLQRGRVQLRTGLVDLGGRSIRRGQRRVGAQRSIDFQRPVGQLVGGQGGDERIVSGSGEYSEGPLPGGEDGPRNIHALACGLQVAASGPLHRTGLQCGGQFDGLVQRRVAGQRHDHATTTSTSAASRAAASSVPGCWSVTRVSMASREAKRTRVSWSNLELSASSTTRRALATKARLTAASSGSGVLRPKPACNPLVPMKAMSARYWEYSCAVRAPLVAPVRPRTRPPMSSRAMSGQWIRAEAMGKAWVMTTSPEPALALTMRSARISVVVPASMMTEASETGSKPRARCAIRALA